jgi:hypothetical protein
VLYFHRFVGNRAGYATRGSNNEEERCLKT